MEGDPLGLAESYPVADSLEVFQGDAAPGAYSRGTEWLVRLRVAPSGAAALARALARRPDTAWVTVRSSGTEIVCIVRAPAGRAAPPAEPTRHPRILDVEAHRLLRHLMDRRWAGRTSALTGEQVSALRSPARPDAAPINDLDRRLLPAPAADGRAAYPSLARHTGWSESAIRRRPADLRRSGTLRFDVEADPGVFGFPTQCLLWLTVTPSRLSSVARALAADAEAAFVGVELLLRQTRRPDLLSGGRSSYGYRGVCPLREGRDDG